jgi:O-antigen ligase
LAVAVGIALYLIPENTWSRLGSIAEKLQALDFNNRMENWIAGTTIYVDHPYIGVGAGAFEGATAHLITVPRSSHSTWLGVVVETGLVGATLWFSSLAYMVSRLWHADSAIKNTLLSSLIPMVVGMAILGWDHRKVPWLLFALCLCAGAATRPSTGAEAVAGLSD